MQDVIILLKKLTDINQADAACQKYIAIRLQCNNFICATSRLLAAFGQETINELQHFTEFVLKGFGDSRLTLIPSAACFVILCEDCSDLLSPFTEQFVQQILVPEFISNWSYQNCYTDIVEGFACLIDKVCTQDL